MSKMKKMMVAWLVVGAITVGAVYTAAHLPQPAYALKQNC